MRVKYYLNTSSRQAEKVIYAHIYLRPGSNKAYILNTGRRLEERFWDKDNQKAQTKGKNKFYAADELNLYLDKYRQDLILFELNLRNSNESITADEIEAAFDARFKTRRKEKNLFEYIDEYVELSKSSKSRGAYYKYYNVRNQLKQFEDATGYSVTFQSMNLYFYDKYVQFLLTVKNHTNNTINRDVKFLKTFLNWAYERGITPNDTFRKFQPPKVTDADVIFLTREELYRFYEFNGFSNQSLTKVRDVFCFACFTGARYSDVSKIGREQIKGDNWHIKSVKTGAVLKIPLGRDAQNILKRYENDTKPLPIMSNQKTNKYLKMALQEAGIDAEVTEVRIQGSDRTDTVRKKYEVIGTHTARRTFVTLSLEAGMKPETIMKITGHTSYKMLKKYLNVTDKLTAAEYKKAWNE